MPILNITQADIMKTKNLQPGWYTIKCLSTAASKAKSGTSMNYVIKVVVTDPVANGKEIDITINSQLLGKIEPIINAMNYPSKFEPGTFDLDSLVGKECDTYIAQREFNGNLFDDCQQFVALGMGKNMQAPY